MSATRRMVLPLAVVSAAVTAYQITLMQVFSYLHWHHFAFLMIALALLGFGASGTCLALAPRMLEGEEPRWLPWVMLGCGLAMGGVVALTQVPFLHADFYLVFALPGEAFKAVAAVMLLTLPFFLGALVLGAILTKGAGQAGTLYAASLLGAGLGGAIALACLETMDPARLPAAIGLLPCAAGILAYPPSRGGRWGFAGIAVALGVFLAAFPPPLVPSQFKDISAVRLLPDARKLDEEADAEGFLEVMAAPALRHAPGISLHYGGEIPARPVVLINGDIEGVLPESAEPHPPLLAHATEQLPFAAGAAPPRSALLLRTQGWEPPAHVLAASRGPVLAIEPSEALARRLAGGRADRLEIRHGHPRSYLLTSGRRFDLIRFPSLGALGGSSGVSALSEFHLFTEEAFADAWRRLSEDGAFVVTGAVDYPPRIPQRLMATVWEGLRRAGVAEPGKHLAAVRSWATVTFLVRRQPVSSSEAAAIRSWSERMGFDPLWLPGLRREEMERHHQLQDSAWLDSIYRAHQMGGRPEFESTVFKLSAPTDDQPFFLQFIRLSALPALAEAFGGTAVPYFELGMAGLLATLALLLALSAVLILLPLTRLGWRGGQRGRVFLYFGGLGCGYMLVEIVWMQRAALYLGHPVIAAAVVIGALLVSSGFGSLWSQRWSLRPGLLRRVAAVAAGVIAASGLAVLHLHQWGGDVPAMLRWLAVLMLIAPVGFVMGLPFPLGLRLLQASDARSLPWAWGINGCFSVLGPPLALLIAVEAGYTAVILAAAGAYAIAAAAAWRGPSSSTAARPC